MASAEVRALEKRIRELERVLGKKTLENEILREALKVAHEKKLISRLPWRPDEDLREARGRGARRLALATDGTAQERPKARSREHVQFESLWRYCNWQICLFLLQPCGADCTRPGAIGLAHVAHKERHDCRCAEANTVP